MKFLVTGGCGFIGSHLVEAIIKDGHHVVVLDDLSSGKQINLPDNAEFIFGDVRDKKLVNSLFEDIDGCFHLAAIASVEKANQNWAESSSINLGGSINVFYASRLQKEKKSLAVPVVWASSAAVYGRHKEMPIGENVVKEPISPYGADKLASELHGFSAARSFGVPNIALRLFNVYGTRQDPNSPYSGVISIFAKSMMLGNSINLYGDGLQSRDFIYVDDIVTGFTTAMKLLVHNASLPAVFNAVNICTGRPTSILQLAEVMADILNLKLQIEYKTKRDGDILHSLGDPSQMKNLLDISAKVDLREGLKKLLDS